MKSEGRMKNINPQIREVEVGIRNLRKIKIYPLSMADQLNLSDNVSSVLSSFFALSETGVEETDVEFVAFFVNLIKDNIKEVLKLVALDEDVESLSKELTNNQTSEIVGIILEDNFADPVKNLKGLFEKAREGSQSKRQLQPSADTMEDIDLNTSSKEASKKEE